MNYLWSARSSIPLSRLTRLLELSFVKALKNCVNFKKFHLDIRQSVECFVQYIVYGPFSKVTVLVPPVFSDWTVQEITRTTEKMIGYWFCCSKWNFHFSEELLHHKNLPGWADEIFLVDPHFPLWHHFHIHSFFQNMKKHISSKNMLHLDELLKSSVKNEINCLSMFLGKSNRTHSKVTTYHFVHELLGLDCPDIQGLWYIFSLYCGIPKYWAWKKYPRENYIINIKVVFISQF